MMSWKNKAVLAKMNELALLEEMGGDVGMPLSANCLLDEALEYFDTCIRTEDADEIIKAFNNGG